jgi:hypothetical protein
LSVPVSDVLEGVRAAIQGATLSLPFTASRAYVVPRDLADVEGLEVTILPDVATIASRDLKSPRYEWGVAVVVQTRISNPTNAEIDPLTAFVKELADLLAFRRLGSVQCVGVELRPVCDPAALDEKGLFSSTIYFTFRTLT